MFWQKMYVIIGAPVVVLVLFVFGMHFDLFHTTAYYDMFMHFVGGGLFVSALAGAAWHLWLKRRAGRIPAAAASKAALVAALVLTSIVWEVFEVYAGMTPNWTLSVADTVSDMACALAGAFVALCLMRIK